MAKVVEGYMPFLEYKTYYRIVGERKDNGKAPVIFLHGGPGSSHNYFEVFDKIADIDDRQLIMYDQIGCGKSFVNNRIDLWVQETWANELIALIKHLDLDSFHLLGQSWGGMLAQIYACDYPHEGLKSVILSSTLPNASLWRDELLRRIKYLSPAACKAIETAKENDFYYNKEFLTALDEFMHRYCSYEVTEDSPECLRREKKKGGECYFCAWGDNEFTPNGTLKQFDYCEKLKSLDVPALVMSGAEDICSPFIAKTIYDLIPDSEWNLFRDARHVCFVEDTEEYIRLLLDWLNRRD